MSWFAAIWIAVLMVNAVAGARIDASEHRPAWFIAGGLLAGALCALFVATYFNLVSFTGSGVAYIVLAVTAGGWFVYEGASDVSGEIRKGTSISTLVLATSVVSLLYLPAAGLGLLHGWRLLNHAF
jgi:hypothetical protein